MKNAVHRIKQLRPATLIAMLALFVAIGGTATAASHPVSYTHLTLPTNREV